MNIQLSRMDARRSVVDHELRLAAQNPAQGKQDGQHFDPHRGQFSFTQSQCTGESSTGTALRWMELGKEWFHRRLQGGSEGVRDSGGSLAACRIERVEQSSAFFVPAMESSFFYQSLS